MTDREPSQSPITAEPGTEFVGGVVDFPDPRLEAGTGWEVHVTKGPTVTDLDKLIELSERAPYLPWGTGASLKTLVASPPHIWRREHLKQLRAGEAVERMTTRRIALIESSAYLTEQEAEAAAAYIVAACNSVPEMTKALKRVREILGASLCVHCGGKGTCSEIMENEIGEERWTTMPCDCCRSAGLMFRKWTPDEARELLKLLE